MIVRNLTFSPARSTNEHSLIKHWMLLTMLCGGISVLHAQSRAFTYQGRLNQNGAPAAGTFDLQFGLFAAPSGGVPVAGAVTHSSVGVTNGLFTVLLNFGSTAFDVADRWLDIAVRPRGSGTFAPLTPRQPITPTPYAITALRAFEVPGISGNEYHAADLSCAVWPGLRRMSQDNSTPPND